MNVTQALRDLASGLANQVTRAKHVAASYAPGGGRVLLQLTGFADETHNQVELLLPYGMSARPVGRNADFILLQINASRDHKVALAGSDPALQIPDLAEGEFGWRDGGGQQVVWRKDHLEVTTPATGSTGVVVNIGGTGSLAINLGSGKLTLDQNGNLAVTGNITAGQGGGDQVDLQNHTHGGVTAGSGHTAAPDAGS